MLSSNKYFIDLLKTRKSPLQTWHTFQLRISEGAGISEEYSGRDYKFSAVPSLLTLSIALTVKGHIQQPERTAFFLFCVPSAWRSLRTEMLHEAHTISFNINNLKKIIYIKNCFSFFFFSFLLIHLPSFNIYPNK